MCGDSNFREIKVHGRPWSQKLISKIPFLPAGLLSDAQLGELNRAYSDEGDQELQTERKVFYYDAVSYDVLGQPDDEPVSRVDEIVKMKVQVGDIIEFQVHEADSRGFAEVVAVMRHQTRVFMVVSWMERATSEHPVFGLPQYRRLPLFGKYRSAFFSLCLVDHPRFVGGTHFMDVGGGMFVRNDWVFNVV